MESSLLSLQSELHNRIYELVFCTQGPAYVVQSDVEPEDRPVGEFWEERRRHVPVVSAYPPGSGEAKLDPRRKEADSQDDDEDEGECELREDLSDSDHAGSALDRYEEYEEDQAGVSEEAFKHEDWRNNGAAHAPDLNFGEYGISVAEGEVTVSIDEMVDEIYNRHPHASRRYNLEVIHFFDLSLLYVNRKINAEATRDFYGGVIFVPGCDPVDTIRFFKQPPARAIESITTLTITE